MKVMSFGELQEKDKFAYKSKVFFKRSGVSEGVTFNAEEQTKDGSEGNLWLFDSKDEVVFIQSM